MEGAATRHEVARYRPLGLIGNPFAPSGSDGYGIGVELEIEAEANRLLVAIEAASRQDAPKPILVSKSNDIPGFYPLRAISMVEGALIGDDSLNVLHAYVQLYLMRRGRVRSALGVVGERLVFRSFERTLAAYIEQILKEPDSELAAYQVLGPDALAEFARRFEEDPLAAVEERFGAPELERRPELAEVADLRLSGLEHDVEEIDTSEEVDETLGNAPGAGIALPEEVKGDLIVDYVAEYTAKHLSSVVARGLRAYVERGLSAMSTELRVTKAPRKTLAAVTRLAGAKFNKTAIIYDGFDNWVSIEPELRQTIVGTLSEMRWILDGMAVFVFLLEEGRVPELEEQFGAGTRLRWDFSSVVRLQEAPDVLDTAMIDAWLTAAALDGSVPLTMSDPILQTLASEAEGSLQRFVSAAAAAIEDAAERKCDKLDDAALKAARAHASRPEVVPDE